MIEAPHYSAAGKRQNRHFSLPAEYFDGTVNEAALHQAVKVFLGNQRQGTHATKTRGFVSGGNQKPWKQKGTGRARQGSTRAAHWRGGGTVFGPQPRDYRVGIPRKLRQLARRSALNARAREEALLVVERLAFDAPKTSRMAELLAQVGVGGRKVLVLTHGHNRNAYLSGRNLPTVQVMNYGEASAYDILWSDAVVVEQAALTGEEPTETATETAEAEAAPAPTAKAGKATKRAPAKKKTAAKTAKRAKAAKKAAKKPAKKAATKAAQKPKAGTRKKKGAD